MMKIINNQLDIKLGQFTQEELDIVLTKIKKQENCQSWWNTTRSMKDKKIRWPNTAMPYTTRTWQRNKQKAASSLSPRKVTLKLPRTTEV